jgi:hypothetical protein
LGRFIWLKPLHERLKPEMGTLKLLKGISRLDLVPIFDLFVRILHRKLTDCGSLTWVFVRLLSEDQKPEAIFQGGRVLIETIRVRWSPSEASDLVCNPRVMVE